MGAAGASSPVERHEVESRGRRSRLPFRTWMAAWTIVPAIGGGIFGVTRLLAAIGGEPSVAGIAPFTVTGVWAGVIAVPYLAVLWGLCGATLSLILYLVYFSVRWVFRSLRDPIARADEPRGEVSRQDGE